MPDPDQLRWQLLILNSWTHWSELELMNMPLSRLRWWLDGLLKKEDK